MEELECKSWNKADLKRKVLGVRKLLLEEVGCSGVEGEIRQKGSWGQRGSIAGRCLPCMSMTQVQCPQAYQK